MFSVILTFAAAMVLVVGIVVSQKSLPLDEYLPEPEEQVLSEEAESEGADAKTEDNNSIDVEVNEESSSINIQITDEPVQDTEGSDPAGLSIQEFIYPGSNIVSQSLTELIINSSASPDDITDWYENRLEGYDMNVNSFVSTRNNGNVENELVSAQGSQEVRIKIVKPAGLSIVEIQIEFTDVGA